MLVTSIFSFSRNIFYAVYSACIWSLFNPLLDHKMLDWSKMKQIADNILKCM